MPKSDTPGTGASAIEDVWRAEDSVLEMHVLFGRLLEQPSSCAIEDENAWRGLFGSLLDAEEVQRRLRLNSVHDVDELVRKKKLLALPTREGVLVYPAFQFNNEDQIYPEIERIIGIFDGVVATPYTIASWLRGPKEYLEGNTPIRWLELERDPEPVLAGAEIAAHRLAH